MEEPLQFQTRVGAAWGAGRGLHTHIYLQHQVQAQDYLGLLCSWLLVSLEFNSKSQAFRRRLNCHRQGKPLCREQGTANCAKMAQTGPRRPLDLPLKAGGDACSKGYTATMGQEVSKGWACAVQKLVPVEPVALKAVN